MRSITPWILGCWLAGFCLPAGAGERIIFSNREGRKVVFDYSRSVRLLPPEIEEGGFNRSGGVGTGSLMPFGDPSMSPTAMRRRKMAPKGRDRDWIFTNPENEGRPKEEKSDTGFEEREEKESAMVKFMRGESNQTREDGREDLAGADNKLDSDPTKRRRKGLDFRELSGIAPTRLSPLEELESAAGFTPVIEGQPELTRFLKADFRRQEDARHRKSMADFRARLTGPSQPTVRNVFGVDPTGGQLGAAPLGQRPISLGINGETLTAPQAPNNVFQGRGIPNAFESQKMPLNAQGENVFNQVKQRRAKRKPLDLSIRKRDF